MTRQTLFFTIITLTLVLAAVPAFAQRGANVGARNGSDANSHASNGQNNGEHPGDHAGGKADFIPKIEANQKLDSKLQALLPQGESLSQAAQGFKNEGQFIAALHVSHNLDIPFDQLKAKMTGPSPMSLGAAIKALRPDLSETKSKEEAKKAEKEAKETEKS
jgi:hypothetical protein